MFYKNSRIRHTLERWPLHSVSVLCTSLARVENGSVLCTSQARVDNGSVLCASQARVENGSVLCASQARVENGSVLCASQARVERVCMCCVLARPVYRECGSPLHAYGASSVTRPAVGGILHNNKIFIIVSALLLRHRSNVLRTYRYTDSLHLLL